MQNSDVGVRRLEPIKFYEQGFDKWGALVCWFLTNKNFHWSKIRINLRDVEFVRINITLIFFCSILF